MLCSFERYRKFPAGMSLLYNTYLWLQWEESCVDTCLGFWFTVQWVIWVVLSGISWLLLHRWSTNTSWCLFHLCVNRDFTAQDTWGQALNPCCHEKEGCFVDSPLLPGQGGWGVHGLSLLLVHVCGWIDFSSLVSRVVRCLMLIQIFLGYPQGSKTSIAEKISLQ